MNALICKIVTALTTSPKIVTHIVCGHGSPSTIFSTIFIRQKCFSTLLFGQKNLRQHYWVLHKILGKLDIQTVEKYALSIWNKCCSEMDVETQFAVKLICYVYKRFSNNIDIKLNNVKFPLLISWKRSV